MNITNKITSTEFFHPGEYLEEGLEEKQMTVEECAKQTQIPEQVIRDIIAGDASVTADIALALEDTLGMQASMWIKLQHAYDDYILSNKRTSYIDRLVNFSRRAAAVL
ncbi:MAG: HigA family addiction module antidote protein [Bacteroidales bacterium]|nr:HigA family addiction module antidote protein [Bacteroidales bacterium]